jgi:hypothetical protein
MDGMTDDRFEEFLRSAARDYNAPPPTPRDEIWNRIAAERAGARRPVLGARRRPVWLVAAVGLAAALLLGVLIGRMSVRHTTDSPSHEIASRSEAVGTPLTRDTVDTTSRSSQSLAARPGAAQRAPRTAVASAEPRERRAYQLATLAHFARAEALLTSVQAESRAGQVDTSVTHWARDLLSTTRLMLDSPAAKDAQLRRLLEDLELVLVQITQLKPGNSQKDDLQYIDQALDERGVLTRLRHAAPAHAGT